MIKLWPTIEFLLEENTIKWLMGWVLLYQHAIMPGIKTSGTETWWIARERSCTVVKEVGGISLKIKEKFQIFSEERVRKSGWGFLDINPWLQSSMTFQSLCNLNSFLLDASYLHVPTNYLPFSFDTDFSEFCCSCIMQWNQPLEFWECL